MAGSWPPLVAPDDSRTGRVMAPDEWLLLPEDENGELSRLSDAE